VVFGGIDMKPQTLQLKAGVEVLIATPGRLLDHIEAKNAVLNQVEYVVLDEADRMLDIGFLPDLQRILSYLPKQRQTLLFSATFSPEIKRLANSYLQDPVTVEVARPNATATTVEQRFYSVADDDKRRRAPAAAPARSCRRRSCSSTPSSARAAGAFLRARRPEDHRAARRQEPGRAPEGAGRLQAGEVDLLVATDVAARGLDIADLPAVFNFDVPVQRRGLRAPHRPHRPRRRRRAGGDAGDARRRALIGDIETDQEEDRDRAHRTRRRGAPPRPAPNPDRPPRAVRLRTAGRHRARRALARAGTRTRACPAPDHVPWQGAAAP
jgi:ATP-dependent RNA helicase RhlE